MIFAWIWVWVGARKGRIARGFAEGMLQAGAYEEEQADQEDAVDDEINAGNATANSRRQKSSRNSQPRELSPGPSLDPHAPAVPVGVKVPIKDRARGLLRPEERVNSRLQPSAHVAARVQVGPPCTTTCRPTACCSSRTPAGA